MNNILIIFLSVIIFSGCATAKISSTQTTRAPSHAVNAIAISPSSGVIADAIAVELFNLGYNIYDMQQTSNILIRIGINEIEVNKPSNLLKLKKEGIDAYLSARTVGGHDSRPESASVRITSTHTGEIIAGLTWQNGWAGNEGSPADRILRSNLSDAASQISKELAARLK